MDEIDRANELAELFRQNALNSVKPVEIPKGIGMCMNCGAEVEGDRRFCDADCRDDHERYSKGH